MITPSFFPIKTLFISIGIVIAIMSGPAWSKDSCLKAERGLIVLTQFPDIRHGISRNYAERRFLKELDEYVREMSYGSVCIKGEVSKEWVTLPDPIQKYRISSRNLEVDKDRVHKLIVDALEGVEKGYKLSEYSFIVVFLGAKMNEFGMMGLCGYPGMLGWSDNDLIRTKGGQTVRSGVAIYSFQAHLGTLFHDIAHILGGMKDGNRMVPCLYDHDLQAKAGDLRETFIDAGINMGFWDPMSSHFYKWDLPPQGISSWTKLRLGWIDRKKVKVIDPTTRSITRLAPLEEGDSDTLVIKIPLTDSTFYLIENRQRRGFDKNLPGSGVLIMYGDDRIYECRKGRSPVKLMDADPSWKNLVEAAFDLGKREEFIDRDNNIRIRLLSKENDTYTIEVGPL